MKIIGVTSRFSGEGLQLKQACNDDYLRAMQEIGFTPILLPIGMKIDDRVLDLCDGFLITGGADILPKFYNQECNGSCEGNEETDLLDKVVIEYAVKTAKPMLGICRGHQAINVFLGGDLIQDIGVAHKSSRHDLTTVKNRLIDLPDVINVNSFHHQIPNRIADGMIQIARSEDGCCEACIHESLPIMSFQCHPERMRDEEVGRMIFQAFRKLVE